MEGFFCANCGWGGAFLHGIFMRIPHWSLCTSIHCTRSGIPSTLPLSAIVCIPKRHVTQSMLHSRLTAKSLLRVLFIATQQI